MAELQTVGVDARAVTLTGLGERAHLISLAVDLETHIRDIVAVIEYEELERGVLVGHSYAGILMGGGQAHRLPGPAARVFGRARPGARRLRPEAVPDGVAKALSDAARRAGGACPSRVGSGRRSAPSATVGRFLTTNIVVSPKDARPSRYPLTCSRSDVMYNLDAS